MYEQVGGGPLITFEFESTDGRRSNNIAGQRRRGLRRAGDTTTANRSIAWTLVPALLISLIAGIVMAPQAAAATSDVVITASDASFVDSTAPTENKNSLPYLVATSDTYRTFLKFDTSALAGKTITAARLELNVKQIGVTQPGLVAYPSTSSWSAPTLTYNNRPAADTRALNNPVLPVTGTFAKVPFTNLTTISKTAATSFQITYNVPSADFWMWKNDANAPRLVVTVTDPATSTAASAAPSAAAAAPSAAAAAEPNAAAAAAPDAAAAVAPAAIVGAGAGPVNVPAASTHKKLVFAHYFTPYPISLDNKAATADYYTKNYLNPAGEGGKFASSGGLLRDRPLPRAVSSSTSWKLEDKKTEVRQAMAAGIDGFSINILNLAGGNWDSTIQMLTAAHAVSPSFKIMLMPDMSAATAGYDAATLASKMATLGAYPAAYRIAGALVIAPFKAEGKTVAWWTSFKSAMSGKGINVSFMPNFVDPGANIAKFAPISTGMGSWGVRNPSSILNGPNWAAQAHSLGKKWMAPIAVQDSRPTQFVYAESANTETLRASWKRAIDDGADFAQLITWNDYSEMTSFAPSPQSRSPTSTSAPTTKRPSRPVRAPAVAREAVIVTHRIQAYSAKPTYAHRLMVWWNGGSGPRNTVEVLTFLKSAATVKVTVGTTTTTYTAPAGVSAKLVPLTTGSIKATATRGTATIGVASSPFVVKSAPYVQDMEYFAVSSLRPNTK